MSTKKDEIPTSDETTVSETPEIHSDPRRQKPVIIYILVLFVVAFMLMALSLLMNQRSHEEALGELTDSITAMREAQSDQNRMNQLQEDLDKAKEMLTEFENAAETARTQAFQTDYALERTQEAMDWFWQLDEAYVLNDTQRCAEILAEMNQNSESPMQDYLSGKAADRYTEILAALWEP